MIKKYIKIILNKKIEFWLTNIWIEFQTNAKNQIV
jgi:hypothetical protein